MSWIDLDQKLTRIKAKLAFLYTVFEGISPNHPMNWNVQTISGLAFIMSEVLEELEDIHLQVLDSKDEDRREP